MKKVPRLRFRGFSEDWELCKLGEESDVRDGTHDSPKYFDDGYPLVTSKNLKDFGLDLSDVSLISYKDFKSINKRSKVDIGDILFGMIGTIGNPVQIFRDDFAIKNVALIKEQRKILNGFLIHILKSPVFDRYIRNENAGGTQKFLALSKVRGFEFLRPNIEEQVRIGNLFKQIDNTITLHQRKLEQLKELKKAYLQLMFPKKDEIVPRMRFVDFEGEWELCKLGDVANRYDNLRVPITASKRISGNTPYYGANGIQDFVEGYTHDGEFILVAEDGANDLKDYPVQYVNGKVWVNNHAHVLQAKQSIANNKFLMNAIKNINIELFLVGGSRAKLNADIMMKLEINMPVKNEQIRVSEFCTQLDNIITIYQNKLNQLKSLKKSYLQNMFI
ncbi:restriction endonuclease subunit S [Enterococcus faecalis]|uniref:restriction endonuclease subunit S n=1 Tax=Enterococcus faecalis TaxID=1351 RepID=UPI001CF2BB73|nr:restriction endonuclease subunit S [Enterococcus faecalis]MCA6725403.1 restriction endonuclease subunit S [Enterococcus faecalis]MCA6751669.1 restriction endonuclease subunit S [Enterococcus faecalis]MCB5964610.1 restriction endonuclease subunit S [Enterococcus faecalis]